MQDICSLSKIDSLQFMMIYGYVHVIHLLHLANTGELLVISKLGLKYINYQTYSLTQINMMNEIYDMAYCRHLNLR